MLVVNVLIHGNYNIQNFIHTYNYTNTLKFPKKFMKFRDSSTNI